MHFELDSWLLALVTTEDDEGNGKFSYYKVVLIATVWAAILEAQQIARATPPTTLEVRPRSLYFSGRSRVCRPVAWGHSLWIAGRERGHPNLSFASRWRKIEKCVFDLETDHQPQ